METDMMTVFKDIDADQLIFVKLVDQMREAYSLFCYELMQSKFTTVVGKVPLLVAHMHRAEWKVIGKILFKGFLETGYLPIGISRAVMMQVFDGQEPSDEQLVNGDGVAGRTYRHW